MRAIKFRAWDKEQHKMLFNEERGIALSGKLYNESDDWFYAFDDRKGSYEGKDIELMQYTGLKDKNGKDIYEGDILKHQIWSYTAVKVIWDDCMFRVITVKGEEHNLPLVSLQTNSCEVIGNVYENPELLRR